MSQCNNCYSERGDAKYCPMCGHEDVQVAAPVTQAMCAVHAGSPSVMTCTRCGSFACERCKGLRGGLCTSCERMGDTQSLVVAKAQRQVILFFGLGILQWIAGVALTAIFSPLFASTWLLGGLVLRVAMAVMAYRLASALGKNIPVLWAIGVFIPNILGVLVLLLLSNHATRYLRERHFTVGFFGANLAQFPQ